VIDHHGQIFLAFAVADLIDPDPPQPAQRVGQRLTLGHDAGDDASHRGPGDPHQIFDR
jgi:hypothetical protein